MPAQSDKVHLAVKDYANNERFLSIKTELYVDHGSVWYPIQIVFTHSRRGNFKPHY